MKKFMLILITLIVISLSATSQSLGDYRSIANGSWNDAAKWETYNGSNWISTTSYPGQNSGTGTVTIMNETEITITSSLPHSISSLNIHADFDQILPSGRLLFSSENPISLIVEGDVIVYGSMAVADQIGAKSHLLSIGGSLVAGTQVYIQDTNCVDLPPEDCPGYYMPFGGDIRTIYNDDKLGMIFNTANPSSSISGVGVSFQDVTFNGLGILINTRIDINGNANFTNGIVRAYDYYCLGGYGMYPAYYYLSDFRRIFFNDGATVSGASSASFIDGIVSKIGDDPFTFPIGKNGVYAPLEISAPSARGEFIASYGRTCEDPALWGISDAGLYSVSNCEYWALITPYGDDNNDYTMDITVSWTSASGCGSLSYIANVQDITLAHFDGTGWASHGGIGAGTTTNGFVTWSGASNLGYFTLGNLNTNCITPFSLTSTNITTNSATLSWGAVNGAVSYDVDYKPSTTHWWTNAATATTSTSTNISGLNPLVTYNWRVRAHCSSSSSAYRVAQFTTQNPCSTPSGLTTTNITSSNATLNWGAVANIINYSVQYKQSTTSSWTNAIIGTTSLSYNLSGLTASTDYDWRVAAVCYFDAYTAYGSNASQASFTTTVPSICNDIYEPNNTSSQAKTVNLGTSISASIFSTTDIDWFKVTTPNNSNTQLEVILSSLPADYDLYVYNKNLILVGSSTHTGISNEVVTYNSNARKATFYIKIVGKDGAHDISQCYSLLAQVSSTGRSVTNASTPLKEINEGSNLQLLYPNPASEFVYLNFNSATEGLVNLQIVNSIGQLVKQYPVNTINGYNQIKIRVADIRPGMYILRINKGDLNLTRKFVIAR